MSNVPIRFDGGVDVNNKSITRVKTPTLNDTYHAVNVEFIENLGIVGDSETMYVDVIDVISGDVDSPVEKEYKNGIFLESASTASEDISIILRFGKKFNSRLLPDIQYYVSDVDLENDYDGIEWESLFEQVDREDFDFSIIGEQILGNGTIEVLELDYVQTFKYTLNDVENGKFYYFKNGIDITNIELIGFEKPIIQTAEIISTYSGETTELADNKEYKVEVTSDVGIYEIEIKGQYLTTKNENTATNTTTESIATETKSGPTNVNAGVEAYFEVRVKDKNGTWSDWYDSSEVQSGENEKDYMIVNNTQPTFVGVSVAYNIVGHDGIDLVTNNSNSYATITISEIENIGSGSVMSNPNSIVSGDIDVEKNSDTSFKITAIGETYQYDMNTVTLLATRKENGRTRSSSVRVNIASQDMSIGNMSVNKFRSGPDSGHETNFNITGTNQRILNSTLTLDNLTGIGLVKQGTISGLNLNSASINVNDDATKGLFENVLTAKFTGISGREVTKKFNIENVGFTKRVLREQNITIPVILPNAITNISNFTVYLGDDVAGENGASEIKTYYEAQIKESGFVGGDQAKDEYCVYEDSGVWKIIFDDTVMSKANPGLWNDNAIIIIEETI